MHSVRVPFRPTPTQLVFFTIAVATAGISLLNQLSWCAALTPNDGGYLRIAYGCALEAMKIAFGLYAVHGILYGAFHKRVFCVPLLLFSVALSLASILATIGHQVQGDMAQHQAALASSKPYQRDEQKLEQLNQQIAQMQDLAKANQSTNYKSRAGKQLADVKMLMAERDALDHRMRNAERSPTLLSSDGYFVKMAAAVTEIGPHTGSALQLKSNKFIALAIELGNLFSISILVATLHKRASSSKTATTLRIVKDEQEEQRSRRHYRSGGARTHNDKVATGRGDTSVDLANPNSARFRRILSGWADGTLGTTYEALQEKENMSPRLAGECLHAGLKLGALKRVGKRFRVVRDAPCFAQFMLAA